MIATVTSDAVFAQLEEMNQVGRYRYYRAKATDSIGVCTELDRLAAFSHVIVELAILDSSSDMMLQWLLNKSNVIVLAGHLKPYDVVVRDFYGMGITDVVTVKDEAMQKQLNEILLRDGAQEDSPPPIASPVEHTPSPPAEIEPEKIIRIAPPRREPVEHANEPPAAPAAIPTPTAPSYIKPPTSKAQTIAFAGGGFRIGTTTQVFQTALYLMSMYHKPAIVDLSNNDWDMMYEEDYEIEKHSATQYTVHGIPLYVGGRQIARLKGEYDVLLFDYGAFEDITDPVSFMEKDAAVIVCGFKAPERQTLIPIFESDPGNFLYLFTFVPDYQHEIVRNAMSDARVNTHFAGYTPDMWKYGGNDGLYSRISGAGSKAAQPKKQRGFFGLLAKEGC